MADPTNACTITASTQALRAHGSLPCKSVGARLLEMRLAVVAVDDLMCDLKEVLNDHVNTVASDLIKVTAFGLAVGGWLSATPAAVHGHRPHIGMTSMWGQGGYGAHRAGCSDAATHWRDLYMR
jgi:hypothetical protein